MRCGSVFFGLRRRKVKIPTGVRAARGLRRLCLALGLAVAPALSVCAQDTAAPGVELTLAQARAAMAQAVKRGDLRTARVLGYGLARSGAADGQVYYLLADIELKSGRPDVAFDAARAAYRLSGTPVQRFQAAQLAARAAFNAGQPTMAQLWLRRTYQAAPDEAARKAIARDFQILRAVNPFNFRLAFGASPSSNVNNGSVSEFNIIDGVPVVGLLSPTAQALSGLEYFGDVQLSYRLGALRRDRRVTAEARFYHKGVRLSAEARDAAPTAKNGDFAYTLAEAGLRARFQSETGGAWGGGLMAGQSWYGGARYFHFARAEAQWSRPIGENTGLSVAGYFERRLYDANPTQEKVAQVGVGLTHILPGGSTLGARLSYRINDLTGITRDARALTARLTWTPAEPIGPVSVTFGLNAAYEDYPDYQIGFIAVPGGRQDTTIGADVSVRFDRLDYAGFVPTLNVSARRTSSNVSRFETEELSVGFGIRSAF